MKFLDPAAQQHCRQQLPPASLYLLQPQGHHLILILLPSLPLSLACLLRLLSFDTFLGLTDLALVFAQAPNPKSALGTSTGSPWTSQRTGPSICAPAYDASSAPYATTTYPMAIASPSSASTLQLTMLRRWIKRPRKRRKTNGFGFCSKKQPARTATGTLPLLPFSSLLPTASDP